MTGIFRILFFILIGYLIYNVVRMFFFMARGSHARKKAADPGREAGDRRGNRSRDGGDRVIELDKDQYKVE